MRQITDSLVSCLDKVYLNLAIKNIPNAPSEVAIGLIAELLSTIAHQHVHQQGCRHTSVCL